MRPRAVSLAPGLQKQPVRTEMRRSAAAASTFQKSTTPPARIEHVERDGAAAVDVVGRTVEPDQRRPVGMAQRRQAVQQPARENLHAPVDRRHADRRHVAQPDLDGGQPEVVDRAVLEADLAVAERVTRHHDRGDADGPAGEPRASQAGQASRRTTSEPIPVG